jgi:hypothetical protein
MANISFDVIHLCQTIVQCPKTTQMQCYSKGKKSLSISKYLYPFKRVSTPIRCNFFTKDDGNFTADLQNVSFLSLDESIGKIEVCQSHFPLSLESWHLLKVDRE